MPDNPTAQIVIGGALIATGFPVAQSIGASLVVSGIAGALIKPPKTKTLDSIVTNQESALSNAAGQIDFVPVVYGKARIGAKFVFAEVKTADVVTVGSELYVVGVLSHGSIESVEDIYFDNDLAFDLDGVRQLIISVSGPYIYPTASIYEAFYGSDTQTTASPDKISNDGVNNPPLNDWERVRLTSNTKWTTSYRGRGIAYLAFKLVYHPDILNHVPNVQVMVKGKKCYDPRTGTTIYTTNPIICLRDYLISTRYGPGIPTGEIDDTAFISEANYCDELINIPELFSTKKTITNSDAATDRIIALNHGLATGQTIQIENHSGSAPNINGTHTVTVVNNNQFTIGINITTGGTGGTVKPTNQKRFEMNGIVDPGQSFKNNIDQILSACRGNLIYQTGKYRPFIRKAVTPEVFELNESNIIGNWRFYMPGINNRVNKIVANWIDPDSDYQPARTEWPVTGAANIYLSDDNDLELVREINLPMTTNKHLAQQIGMVIRNESRFGIACSITVKEEALKLQVGSVVKVTHETPGWVQKEFWVTAMSITAVGELTVGLLEYNSTVYNLDSQQDIVAPDTTTLQDPFSVVAPTNLVLSSDTQMLDDATVLVLLHASCGIGDALTQQIEWQYKKSTDSEYKPGGFSGRDLPSMTVLGVEGGEFYNVRCRGINGLGVRSAWTEGVHEILGKIGAPSDVTGFSAGQNGEAVVMRWDAVEDADLAGYEIRDGGTWETGNLVSKVYAGIEITTLDVKPGGHTFWIKAIDTSGNYSVNAASDDVTVVNIRDVIFLLNQQPDYPPGVVTNFFRHHTGKLVPYGRNAFSSYASFAALGPNMIPDPVQTCTFETLTRDEGFVDTMRVFASSHGYLGLGQQNGDTDALIETDYHSGAGYDGFETLGVRNIEARYWKFKLTVDHGIAAGEGYAGAGYAGEVNVAVQGPIIIDEFIPVLDAFERTEEGVGVAIGAGGTAITFSKSFHAIPYVTMQQSGGTALIAQPDNTTKTGFDAHLFNTSGTGVSGTANWQAKG